MPLICKECKRETLSLINDLCCDCHHTAYTAWQKRMAIRQDPAQFNTGKLINLLLGQHWMHECKIIRDKSGWQVKFEYADGGNTFLRYSKGPLQGYLWDCYGDDMHSPELALIAISQAPAPPHVDRVIPTHGK